MVKKKMHPGLFSIFAMFCLSERRGGQGKKKVPVGFEPTTEQDLCYAITIKVFRANHYTKEP